jgi:hemin uptake protein HemP
MSAKSPDARGAATPATSGPPRESGGPAPIPSATLLQGRDAVMIEHNGRLYQLRQTRQGKLILTK